MRHLWTLTKLRIKLAFRSKIFAFFSLLMPLGIFFIYAMVWGRQNPHAVPYILSMSLALTVMGGFWGMSIQLVIFRETGVLRRFRLAPLTPSAMLGSSILSNFVLVIPAVLLQYALARWLFHMSSGGQLLTAALLAGAGMVTFSALGLIVASVTNTMQETQVVNNALWFVFLFLSGATIPLPVYPVFIQKIALFLPSTYLVTGLQNALQDRRNGWGPVVEDFASLGASFLMAFMISSRLFRWEPDQKYPPRAKMWVAASFIPFLVLGTYEAVSGHRLRDAQEAFRQMQAQAESQQPRSATQK